MTPYRSENIIELAKALLNVQRTVRPIVKDTENPFTKSWYANLSSVMDTCRDALIENGIWLISPTGRRAHATILAMQFLSLRQLDPPGHRLRGIL
ncbi:MAG: ERF family protein [Desulfovibrio sp.]|uniref:ERF family protein n=1 Tax=Desulfovibrio sp. TaxID=885 RepID=UPI0039E6A978